MIKRWEFNESWGEYNECHDGEYVLYKDYLLEIESLMTELEFVENHRNSLQQTMIALLETEN